MENKRILVTGGSGFVGSALVPVLKQYYTEVFAPSHQKYDLVDRYDVYYMYDGFKPHIVIHLAAKVGGIGANSQNPGSFFYENAIMGLHMIEMARIFNVEKFVNLCTICAYPKFTPVPFLEKDLWNGYPEETNAPYGIAKKSLIVMLQAYRTQYGLNGISLMPTNLYGPEDNFSPSTSHVIPALIKKIVEAKNNNQKEVLVWGDGSASREFLYIDDCVRAIALATKYYNEPEPVNVGTGNEISIADLVTTICDIVDFRGNIVWDSSKPNGQPRRCLNVQSAAIKFGFTAKMQLVDGLRKTIKWYTKSLQKNSTSA